MKFLLVMAAVGLVSCAEEFAPVEVQVEKPTNIALYEYLNGYEPLKNHITTRSTDPDFKLGVGIDPATAFTDRGLVYALAVSNFNEIVPTNAMKYGTVVGNDGAMNPVSAISLVNTAKAAGMDVFGHTLVWHAQQNRRWLNSLVAPVIIPAPPRPPQVGGDGGYAMKLSNTTEKNPWDVQAAYNLSTPLTEGGKYTLKFMAKATKAHNLGMALQRPSDYAGDNGEGAVDTKWSEWSYTFTVGEGRSRILFNLGTFIGDLFVDNISLTAEGSSENLIANSDFETGAITGWGGWGGGTYVISENGQGYATGSGYSMKIVATGGMANAYDTQVAYNLPAGQPLTSGTEYTIKFMAKAAASITVPMVMQKTQTWEQQGGSASMTTEWQEFEFKFTPNEAYNQFCFNVGQVVGTFYVDNFTLTETGSTESRIPNGDFETGAITGWAPGGGSPAGVTTEISKNGEGYSAGGGGGMEPYEGGYALELTNSDVLTDNWRKQAYYKLAAPMKANTNYKLTFWAKGTSAYAMQIFLQSTTIESEQNYGPSGNVTTEWTKIELSVSPAAYTAQDKVTFNFGTFIGTIYVDNVSFVEEGTAQNLIVNGDFDGGKGIDGWAQGGVLSEDGKGYIVEEVGDTIIEKTPEEKREIFTAELERWIKGIMEATGASAATETSAATGSYVNAWTLINEPMDDNNPSELRGDPTGSDANNFYWQDYLGKDYARVAAKLARQYGGSDLKLFVSESNLITNPAKVTGLIAMIAYWESDGTTKIDGIGAQMHVNFNTDATKQQAQEAAIVTMFQSLAATGKLIKISELDMGLVDEAGANILATATFDQEQQMSDFYEFIVSKYFELIPAAQRYGITQWTINDTTSRAGLWTTDNMRKPVYGGFADALKGN